MQYYFAIKGRTAKKMFKMEEEQYVAVVYPNVCLGRILRLSQKSKREGGRCRRGLLSCFFAENMVASTKNSRKGNRDDR